jgi:HD-GYP domain-containing protein (c-di-GMP phosphodiesterase class II)
MICLLMARRLGWEEAEVLTLMKAALTMNMAMLDLQGSLAVQGVAPTQGQQVTIQEHPLRAVEMLRATGVDDAAWLDAVAQHHELPGGSGVPMPLSQILRHIDEFVGKISPRAGHTPLPIQQALRELFQEDKGGQVAAAIVKEFGIYPPGEFVQLKSGEMAVVVRRSANARSPIAASVTDRQGMPMVNTVVRDTAKPEFAIVAVVADKSLVLRVPPERLYGLPE